MNQVILIRHAQSEWNAQNRFTGWANPGLTHKGISEAKQAGKKLADAGYTFDAIYSSVLIRAEVTAQTIRRAMNLSSVQVHKDWRLNERHYGNLQGKNKSLMTQTVGEEQVWKWRRSYLEHPPEMSDKDYQAQKMMKAFDDIPAHLLPSTENLANTRARVTEFWRERIQPKLKSQNLLISAHGNTLRALIMELANMSIKQVESFEIPTAEPIVVAYDNNGQFKECFYLRNHESLMAG